MRFNATSCLIGLLLAFGLLACTDHRLGGPLSPARLRLKTVQGEGDNNGSKTTVNTTYSYDDQNRLTGITRVFGDLIVVSYGDPTNKYVRTAPEANNIFLVYYPNPADQMNGTITRYPYPEITDGTDFTAVQYLLREGKLDYATRQLPTVNYMFDSAKRLIRVTQAGEASNVNSFGYSYTGNNVTGELASLSAGRLRFTNTYTYDTQVNPYFGLLDPSINDLVRVSRNNAVKSVSVISGSPTTTTTYDYEYNQQGLPTKQVTKRNGVVTLTLAFGYEAY